MAVRAGKVLPKTFFRREALVVAQDLLGKNLCRRMPDGSIVRAPLTEVEAYIGPEDKACHASKGKTSRTAVMYEPGGVFYVYLCYGVHWLLNIVTDGPGHPAAVLVRGVGQTFGPGRVTKALAVDKSMNALPAVRTSGLWLEDSGVELSEAQIERTPRIGIDYAGEYWAKQPFRLLIKDTA